MSHAGLDLGFVRVLRVIKRSIRVWQRLFLGLYIYPEDFFVLPKILFLESLYSSSCNFHVYLGLVIFWFYIVGGSWVVVRFWICWLYGIHYNNLSGLLQFKAVDKLKFLLFIIDLRPKHASLYCRKTFNVTLIFSLTLYRSLWMFSLLWKFYFLLWLKNDIFALWWLIIVLFFLYRQLHCSDLILVELLTRMQFAIILYSFMSS